MRLQTVLVHHRRIEYALDDVLCFREAGRHIAFLHHRFAGQIAGGRGLFFALGDGSTMRFGGGGIQARHAIRPDQRRAFCQRLIDIHVCR